MNKKFLFLITISLIFFTCSKTSDKDYMKMASDKVEKGNTAEAIKDYESLVNEHPESELAPEAILKQAALYHENKVKNVNQKEALIKSADLYISLSEKYPENKQAPSSLFMGGFIYANEVMDLNKAEKTFKLFLNKYPNHELTSSAKEELNNLGLSPEEILRRKMIEKENI